MIIPIDDLHDPALSDYTSMTDIALRRHLEVERGLFMAESKNVISRAICAGCVPRSFLMEPKWLDSMAEIMRCFPEVPVYTAPREVLRSLTGFHLHRGALAAMQRPDLPSPDTLLTDAQRVAVLENIVDHTNVGAIFRSAAALGVDAVLVTPSCADPLYRRAVRVSMGTVFQVPWTRLSGWPCPQLLAAHGFETVALALNDESVPLDEYAARLELNQLSRVAWILGTEGQGLQPQTISAADTVVRIPMSGGVDSLNVAAAAAVVFWATRRR